MSAVGVYHVRAGDYGIYIGTVGEHGTRWKSECTEEAIAAVRDYLMRQIAEGDTSCWYMWARADGSTVELRVTVKAAQTEDEHMDCPCCGGHDTMVGTRARTSGHFHGRCTQCGARVME